MEKYRKKWAYLGVTSAFLAMISFIVGAIVENYGPMPLEKHIGLALATFFLAFAAYAAGVVNSKGWREGNKND